MEIDSFVLVCLMEPTAHVSGKHTYYQEYDSDEVRLRMNSHYWFHFIALSDTQVWLSVCGKWRQTRTAEIADFYSNPGHHTAIFTKYFMLHCISRSPQCDPSSIVCTRPSGFVFVFFPFCSDLDIDNFNVELITFI